MAVVIHFLLLSGNILSKSQGLVLYTLLLFLYLYSEMRNLWAEDKYLFWINPIVLASVVTFILTFGISNFIYFLPEDLVSQVGLMPVVTPYMDKLMFFVVLGAVAMWSGYYSLWGKKWANAFAKNKIIDRVILNSTETRPRAIYSLIGVSLLSRLWAIKMGLFGYSSSYDKLVAAASYTMYLAMAQSLGQLALVAIGIEYFSSLRPTRKTLILLVAVTGYEVLFGFLSGFKSAVVMPLVILGVVYYSQRSQIPKLLIMLVFAGLFAAYAIIEPFRAARNADVGFTGTSLNAIGSTMLSAESAKSEAGTQAVPRWLSIFARMNLTYTASLGIEYAAAHKLPAGSPDFLGDIFLAPLYAVVPRFLWTGKPLGNLGLWYTNVVYGEDSYSATGMGPFTYLNFAGGVLAIFCGFYAVGVFQKWLFYGLRGVNGGGIVILLGLLSGLVNVDSAFNTFFVNIIRMLPILMLAQYFVFKKKNRVTYRDTILSSE